MRYLEEMEKREIIAKNGSIGVTDKGKKFHNDYSKINDLISEISKTITEE
jgi:predicted transcriptional regulator